MPAKPAKVFADIAPLIQTADLGARDILIVLAALNLVAFAAFGFDKARAANGGWRVRESTLLWLAFLGGTPGAYAGRRVFRHKTRKQPFCHYLHTICALQITLLAGLGYYLSQ